MVSEARKKKRRKLNRRRRRLKDNIAREKLQQQRLKVKPKQESTLFYTRGKRESFLTVRSEMGQISDSQYPNADARQIPGKQKKQSAVEKRRIYNREKHRRRRMRRKNEKMAMKEAEKNLRQQRLRIDPQARGSINDSVAEAGEYMQQLREEMPDNRNVDAQQNLEEQRRLDIERQRKEERLRLEQIQPTVLFDELSRPRELMKEFGFRDCDGF